MSPYWARVCLYDNNLESSGTEVEAVSIDYYVGGNPAAADQDVGVWLGLTDATERMIVDSALSGELEFATVVSGRWDSRYGQNYQVGQL